MKMETTIKPVKKTVTLCKNCTFYKGNKSDSCVSHNRFNEIVKTLDRGEENSNGNCRYYEEKEKGFSLTDFLTNLKNA